MLLRASQKINVNCPIALHC